MIQSFTIAHYVMFNQPDIYERIIKIYRIPRVKIPEPQITVVLVPRDELTREQRELEKIMKQRPLPGIAGTLPGEGS